jgi:hypothetical protein
MRVVVEIVSGARAGTRLEFADRAVIRLGRHPQCEVAFDPEADRDASSRHAELRVEGGALVLHDLGSANGTRVGGRAVRGHAPVPPGSEVECGSGGPRVRVDYTVDAVVPPTVFKPGGARAGGGDTKLGRRTVAMMIAEALGRADAADKKTVMWLRLSLLGAGMLLVAVVILVVVVLRGRSPDAIRREMVKVMEQQRTAAEGQRADLQKRLEELSARLGKGGGAQIAKNHHDGLWLVTVRTGVTEDGFCTAFAVAAKRAATNAHCVYLAEDYRRRGGQIFLVQNGHPDTRLRVVRMKRSPDFRPNSGISVDVGWMEPESELSAFLPLAPANELKAVATGDLMFTYGFPGRLNDVSAPEATFVEGVVGRVTTIDGRNPELGDTQLIQHSAFSTGGTSGSPVFNAAGHVIAVNTGGYSEQDGSQKSTRTLAGYNFAMRVDLLQTLLNEE